MSAEPTRSLEVERSYDVDADTPLPDLTTLGLTVGHAEPRDLDARYFDSADAALGRAGVAVRRRTGGPDEGWHVKIATPEGKLEWHWPLDIDSDPDQVPPAVAESVERWSAGPFAPLARIRNARTAYAVSDASGTPVAELVDDRVQTVDERTGRELAWREWEVELTPESPVAPAEFFARIDAAVAAAGGRVAASDSKLARALGF